MSQGNKGDPRAVTAIDREIGARIRKRRHELAMSQEQLGDAIGVTFQQVQKYESGLNRIAARTLMAIAGTLDMNASDLLPEASFKSVGKDELSGLGPLVTTYTRLNDKGRRLLLETAQTIAADPDFKRL
jgi:transcriptional regulator with XRE-family HTH domain